MTKHKTTQAAAELLAEVPANVTLEDILHGLQIVASYEGISYRRMWVSSGLRELRVACEDRPDIRWMTFHDLPASCIEVSQAQIKLTPTGRDMIRAISLLLPNRSY